MKRKKLKPAKTDISLYNEQLTDIDSMYHDTRVAFCILSILNNQNGELIKDVDTTKKSTA